MRFVDVAPRDGLQNERATIPTDAKIAFVDALSTTGVGEIEVSSFVSPKWVPQLADAEDVFRHIKRKEGILYSALVPNERGLERAQSASVDKIAVFTAASESFNKRNINASIAESIERFRPVMKKAGKLPVRGYISTAFWCPYEGRIEPEAVTDVIRRLVDLGVGEVSIGDTTGKASPADVRLLLDEALPCEVPLALHFHDTYGMAVANAMTAWKEYRIDYFDASAGGLGGCPYAPGASGNVAMEDLVYAFQACGADTDMDVDVVIRAARGMEPLLGHGLASHLSKIR